MTPYDDTSSYYLQQVLKKQSIKDSARNNFKFKLNFE